MHKNNQYPTVESLKMMNVPFYIVIEEEKKHD